MFYLSSLTKDICIFPKDFSNNIKGIISVKIKELEGKIIGKNGYIISIVEFNQVFKGKIDNETGTINYRISYKAITFKLAKNEILDVIPDFINEHGIFCKVGPVQIFISKHDMKDWKYSAENNVWMFDKEILKNEEEISDDEKSDLDNKETDIPKNIQLGKIIRIKIIAISTQSNEMTALGKLY